jgi:hypothetical protein
MALSDILSSSPLVRGGSLAGALAQGAQGALQGMNDRREMNWQDEQRGQIRKGWERTSQEQALSQTAALPGETDADRMERIAALADKTGFGDLASKYRATAKGIKEEQGHKDTAQAARLIYSKNYPAAAALLNRAGTFGKIHDIGPGSQPGTFVVNYEDPATGQSKPVELDEQILPVIADNAKNLAAQMQAYQQGKDLGGYRSEALKDKDLDRDARIAQNQNQYELGMARVAAIRAARAAGGNRLALVERLARFYQSPEGGGLSATDAMAKARKDPNEQEKDARSMLTAGINISKEGIKPADLKGTLESLRGLVSDLKGNQNPFDPPKKASTRLGNMGLKPVPEQAGTYEDTRGRRFRENGNKIEQWSKSGNTWVDITSRLK